MLKASLNRFIRDEQGSATIEFVLWLPVFMALLVVVVDATTLFLTHKEMVNTARDTARRMVMGQIQTEADAEAYAASAVKLRDFPYTVVADYDLATGARVSIALTTSDLSIVGNFTPLKIYGTTIVASVIMRADPTNPFVVASGGGGPIGS